jgi:hypothetical protein
LVKLITLALVTLTKKADADVSASKKLAGVEVYPRTDIYYEEIKVHSGKVPFYKACQLTKLRVCLTYKVRFRAVALAVTASSREVSSKPIAKT